MLNAGELARTSQADTALGLSQLEDQLLCWLFSSDAIPKEVPSAEGSIVLKELARRVDSKQLMDLPRQPLSLPKLMQALADDSLDRGRLGKIILSDPTLTNQLLRVANSSYFRSSEQAIESVDQAIFRLGINGVRSLASAAVLRPVLSARNSQEALFAKRVWRWGLACGQAVELVAQAEEAETEAYFLLGLVPALVYMTLCREVHTIQRARIGTAEVQLNVIQEALKKYQWPTAQVLAGNWNLPPRFNAHLFAAERPAPHSPATPLNDGIIMGTYAALQQAGQPIPSEDVLFGTLSLRHSQFKTVQSALAVLLKEESSR